MGEKRVYYIIVKLQDVVYLEQIKFVILELWHRACIKPVRNI